MTLREYRLQQGWTLQQLGKLLGRHFTTVHKWESGERIPTAIMVAAIERLTEEQVRASSFIRSAPRPLSPSHRAKREARQKARCRETV